MWQRFATNAGTKWLRPLQTRCWTALAEHTECLRQATLCAGIGPDTGKALMKRFPTALAMHQALDQCGKNAQKRGAGVEAACLRLLSDVPISLSRKLGPTAAKSVYQQLFQAGWHSG
jgi:hypothetical protein